MFHRRVGQSVRRVDAMLDDMLDAVEGVTTHSIVPQPPSRRQHRYRGGHAVGPTTRSQPAIHIRLTFDDLISRTVMVEDKPRVHVFVLQPRVSINGDCNVAYSPSGSADLTRRFMKTTVYGFQHRYDSPSIPGGSVDDVQAHNRRASRRQCNRPFRRVRTFADIRRADEQPGRVLIADSHAHRGVVVAGHDSRRRQHAAESRILDERQFITCLMSDQHPITAVNQIGAGHHTDDTGTGHGQCTWIGQPVSSNHPP